jgi:hypothetical protein
MILRANGEVTCEEVSPGGQQGQPFGRKRPNFSVIGKDREMIHFTRKTKIYVSEMKPLLKPAHWTPRMVMRQKTMRFLFARPARVREKRLNAVWKSYVSGPFNGKPP